MGVNRMAGTLGWTMEPPAATEYAVLPVGVASMTPSACTCPRGSLSPCSYAAVTSANAAEALGTLRFMQLMTRCPVAFVHTLHDAQRHATSTVKGREDMSLFDTETTAQATLGAAQRCERRPPGADLGDEAVALPALDLRQEGVGAAVDHDLVQHLVDLLPRRALAAPPHDAALQAHAQRDVHAPHLRAAVATAR